MIKENDIDYIIPNLYLGNYESSKNMAYIKKYNIKYIICIMLNIDEQFKNNKDITYFHIPIKDEQDCKNIKVNYKILFDDITKLIDYLLKLNNGSILVHCKKGHHRSAAIVAHYLVNYHNYELNTVINYIKQKRPLALRRNCCIMENLWYFNKK